MKKFNYLVACIAATFVMSCSSTATTDQFITDFEVASTEYVNAYNSFMTNATDSTNVAAVKNAETKLMELQTKSEEIKANITEEQKAKIEAIAMGVAQKIDSINVAIAALQAADTVAADTVVAVEVVK